jgi:hypothetical protein
MRNKRNKKIDSTNRMPRHRAYKDDFSIGLEDILNNPKASFTKSPAVFNEIHSKSNMSIGQMLKYIGKRRRNETHKQPSDAERSQERLGQLEEAAKKE